MNDLIPVKFRGRIGQTSESDFIKFSLGSNILYNFGEGPLSELGHWESRSKQEKEKTEQQQNIMFSSIVGRPIIPIPIPTTILTCAQKRTSSQLSLPHGTVN